MFARLGHSALWDDEAPTALGGIGVWRTGDTSAVIDHNIVAYGAGFELRNMRMRFLPPLMFYLVAPSIGILGRTAFAARLPFAMCGLATIAFIAFWMWRDRASLRTWLVMTIGLLGNVSLILYLRQCRYYAPAILLCTVIAYTYLHWGGSRRILVIMALLLVALLSTTYMAYVVVLLCLLADYLIWHRRQRSLDWRDWLVFLIPQIVLGGLIFAVWNPFGAGRAPNWIGGLLGRLWLLWLNLRDLNTCEFTVGVLLILAPVIYFFNKDKWLLRGPLAILLFCLGTSLVDFHEAVPGQDRCADVRYLAPLIPLCVFVVARVLLALTGRVKYLLVPLAVVVFGTNVFHGGRYRPGMDAWPAPPRTEAKPFDSTFVRYILELIDPPPSALAATAEWINHNVSTRRSIWVVPDYMTLPLMFHAPEAMYAWQLKDPPEERFKSLPPIHFFGRVPPDYVVILGPNAEHARPALEQLAERGGATYYRPLHRVDLYWYDFIRPEIPSHAFEKVTDFDPTTEGVVILQPVRQSETTSSDGNSTSRREGTEMDVAYCPERVAEGVALEEE